MLIRVGAAPINPSDLGVMFAGADLTGVEADEVDGRPRLSVALSPGALAASRARVGHPLPVGNEGAGTVVAAGPAPEAQALLGRTVAVLGGAMYSQYRTAPAAQVLALPDDVDAVAGAACFVNPLTALGMVGTMQLEGHTALVHTAAASNLGQMLNRLCLADGIGLVNVVRRPEHVELLRSQGAEHVCDTSSPSFDDDLTEALVATGATVAFDAIGGGDQAGRILAAMERAVTATSGEFQRYGSSVHKQVYVYGGLDRSPTVVHRTFGMAWGIGGWLLMPFLQRVGADETARLRARVADEITTTFASSYTDQVDLRGALDPAAVAVYGQQATGRKYLVRPND